MDDVQTTSGASDPVCANCNRTIGHSACYRLSGQIICGECAGLIARVMGRSPFRIGPFLRGALSGFAAAIGFAVLWAMIAKWTGFSGGLIAIFIGVAVSAAVMKGSGYQRGPHTQALSIAIAVFGIWLGKGLCATWSFYHLFEPEIADLNLTPALSHVLLLVLGFRVLFSPVDFIWYGFAIYDGWRRPRAIHVPIEGPFSSQPQVAAGSLQFERAEITHPSAPGTQS